MAANWKYYLNQEVRVIPNLFDIVSCKTRFGIDTTNPYRNVCDVARSVLYKMSYYFITYRFYPIWTKFVTDIKTKHSAVCVSFQALSKQNPKVEFENPKTYFS